MSSWVGSSSHSRSSYSSVRWSKACTQRGEQDAVGPILASELSRPEYDKSDYDTSADLQCEVSIAP